MDLSEEQEKINTPTIVEGLQSSLRGTALPPCMPAALPLDAQFTLGLFLRCHWKRSSMGRSRRQWLKLPLGMFILKLQIPTKCTLGSSFVEKTLTPVGGKTKTFRYSPFSWAGVKCACHSGGFWGPRVHVAGLQAASAGSTQGVGAVHPPHPTICPPIC